MTAHDPFGRSRLPADFTREDRVRLLDEVALALLEGRRPSRAAELFVGGALWSWLREGGRVGSLERDFLKVTAPRRSTLTARRLWERERSSTCRGTSDEADGSVGASTCTEHDA